MRKMPPRLTPIVPAKAKNSKASDVTLSRCNPKFITIKNAKGANSRTQRPMPCMTVRYKSLAAA